ncbi:CAAX protease [Helicobacter salomonis]|uniref:CAAX protease n=1 Tax=Helicobacter salomonis TaxID=56878 RepID=UPI000CF110D9|nr:CAAX protease [Helicobacter salomonis]
MLDIENLLSKRRLDSYGGNLQAHLENLKLIGTYTHKIALIEIALRNPLNHLLSAKDINWINNSTDSRVIQVREKALEKSKGGIS